MNEKLMDTAYSVAREELKATHLAICKKLDTRFAGGDLDPIYRAAVRGQKLWITAIAFAEKVWASSLNYEKALQMLQTQFADFPTATCERALGDAYQETR
jgi:hypothetical protein